MSETQPTRNVQPNETGTLASTSFLMLMECELQNNKVKGDWRTWHPDLHEALSELQHHVEKLRGALKSQATCSITEFSADVANICMKIAEDFGELGSGILMR